MLIGKFLKIKKQKPEIPIAKATGIPKSKKTRKIIIAVPIIYFSPHFEDGVFIDVIKFIAVFMNINSAPTGTHEVTHA